MLLKKDHKASLLLRQKDQSKQSCRSQLLHMTDVTSADSHMLSKHALMAVSLLIIFMMPSVSGTHFSLGHISSWARYEQHATHETPKNQLWQREGCLFGDQLQMFASRQTFFRLLSTCVQELRVWVGEKKNPTWSSKSCTNVKRSSYFEYTVYTVTAYLAQDFTITMLPFTEPLKHGTFIHRFKSACDKTKCTFEKMRRLNINYTFSIPLIVLQIRIFLLLLLCLKFPKWNRANSRCQWF